MIWGCITYTGVGNIVIINGGLDATLYHQILREDLMESIEGHGMELKDVIFQQDNAPAHSAKSTSRVLSQLGINVMQWPANSPDLNPIEHLWAELKRLLRKSRPWPTNVNQLVAKLDKIIDNELGEDYIKKLFHSIPARMEAVIKNKGGYINY